MKIYNTLSRSTEEFNPIKKGGVGLYTCGPTVYNYAHIGNLRTYIFEDILKRVLKYNNYKVKHIMNITDVGHLTDDADTGEDKMEKGAAREGKSAWDIAKFYTKAFRHDLKELNITEPDKFPKATDHIREQINLIKKLEKKGFAYKTSDGIYFDTSRLPDYGKLAQLGKQQLQAGARVGMGEKKNITDFALWKFSPIDQKRQMEWKSPWGIGFPGWHIECSAMAVKYLGQPFDIHCGGIDHIPVHHTNEIAQSEAANGKPLANYWLHGEFLNINEQRMAKSGENFLTLETVKNKGFSPLAYRYLLLQTHYRKQLGFSWEAVQAAQNGLEHLYAAARALPKKNAQNQNRLQAGFLNMINNDLDMPASLALIWTALKEKTIDLPTLLKFDTVLGLEIKQNLKVKTAPVSENVEMLVKERDQARQNKNWAKSDELRAQIEQMDYIVSDTAQGTQVTKK